jgi:predicted nucleic acid-binding protein
VNVVDSSGWLEYLADAPGAEFFAPALEDTDSLIVPSICMLEVARVVHRERGEQAAIQALALMKQGQMASLSTDVILLAARLGKEDKLPLADSVILATARIHGAMVWTQDSHFEGLEGVRYTPKKNAAPPSA